MSEQSPDTKSQVSELRLAIVNALKRMLAAEEVSADIIKQARETVNSWDDKFMFLPAKSETSIPPFSVGGKRNAKIRS